LYLNKLIYFFNDFYNNKKKHKLYAYHFYRISKLSNVKLILRISYTLGKEVEF